MTTQDDAAQWREAFASFRTDYQANIGRLNGAGRDYVSRLISLVERLAAAIAAIRQERDEAILKYRVLKLNTSKQDSRMLEEVARREAVEVRCAAMQAVVDAARQFERTGNWQLAAKALAALPPDTAKEGESET